MERTSSHSRSDQSWLLLYLAEELSAAERVAVQRRLASDAAFAAEFEQLRHCQTWLKDSLDALDVFQPLPGTVSSWQRRMGRLIRQWQVREISQRQVTALPARRLPMLAYAAAAAIFLVVSSVAWLGFWDNNQLPSNRASSADQLAQQQQQRAEVPTDPIQNFTSLAAVEHDVDELADLRTSVQ